MHLSNRSHKFRVLLINSKKLKDLKKRKRTIITLMKLTVNNKTKRISKNPEIDNSFQTKTFVKI